MATFADEGQTLVLLAGATDELAFPPRLNTELPPSELNTAETPEAYGFDLGADGVIAKGTIPSGTARVQRTVTIGSNTYYWHYRRLWRFSGTMLEVGAMDYDDVWQYDGPQMQFSEDSNAILAIVPFGEDNMLVVKSTGSYVIQNCFDVRGPGYFNIGPMVQELRAAAANQVAELDGAVFASNSGGVFSYEAGQDKAQEVTRLVRGLSSSIYTAALTTDFLKKRIIVGSSLVIEGGNVYQYSGSSFRYTLPEIRHKDYNAISVLSLIFMVRHPDSTVGTLSYQTRTEGGNWSAATTVMIPYQSGAYTILRSAVPDPDGSMCRRFQLRITNITGSKQIERIMALIETHDFDEETR